MLLFLLHNATVSTAQCDPPPACTTNHVIQKWFLFPARLSFYYTGHERRQGFRAREIFIQFRIFIELLFQLAGPCLWEVFAGFPDGIPCFQVFLCRGRIETRFFAEICGIGRHVPQGNALFRRPFGVVSSVIVVTTDVLELVGFVKQIPVVNDRIARL